MRLFFSLLLLVSSLHAVDLNFPKLEDARRVRGELVSADFVHRSGQFRTEKGELIHCTDLWVGEDTHKLVIEKQRKEQALAKKKP